MEQSSPCTTLEPGSLFWGVFGYLDATLYPDQKKEAAEQSHGIGVSTNQQSKLRMRIAELINNTFRLQFWNCPLRKELDSYRLYYRNDMADALAAAYCLHKAGMSPVGALVADYAISWGGLLQWVNIDDFRKSEEANLLNIWARFHQFYRKGDRLVYYSLPTLTGRMLVRGDRLVWEVEELHMCVPGGNPRWEAAHAEYERLGGNPAFFAGKFEWPPEGWVNPMTDDEAQKIRRQRTPVSRPQGGVIP